MPRSGCIDVYSQYLANYLVGNPLKAAVLEITLQGPELVFQALASVGVTGAHFDVYINTDLQQPDVTWQVQEGDCLRFGCMHSGYRAYPVASGGFNLSQVLQNQATFLLASMEGTGAEHCRQKIVCL